MTELAIMNDIEYCLGGDCSRCKQFKDDRTVCKTNLLRKAISLLKLQKKENDLLGKKVEKLTKENEGFMLAKMCRVEKNDMFRAVNRVIENAHNSNDYDDGLYDLIKSMQSFSKTIGAEKTVDVVVNGNMVPQFKIIK